MVSRDVILNVEIALVNPFHAVVMHYGIPFNLADIELILECGAEL